ncbi:Hypothetical predicted protein [Olea europaea subsp. europaea]|uniref:Uncharacterized protein n=1 Tax=Olea europaea subsp. europaea TaxID=158383 RepID=A0A8S0VPA2_OLEEU|nr:Hypothetical predicted protein [Olea europaea subsp. europaea]
MPRVSIVQDEKDSDENENASEDESARIPLTVGGNRFITISASCVVSANLKAYLGGPYPTFSLVLVDTKKFLWERFQVPTLATTLMAKK